MMVRPVKNPLFTILFSHGNAVDLGQMSRSVFNLMTGGIGSLHVIHAELASPSAHFIP